MDLLSELAPQYRFVFWGLLSLLSILGALLAFAAKLFFNHLTQSANALRHEVEELKKSAGATKINEVVTSTEIEGVEKRLDFLKDVFKTIQDSTTLALLEMSKLQVSVKFLHDQNDKINQRISAQEDRLNKRMD